MEEYLDAQDPHKIVSIVNPSPHDFTSTVVDRKGQPIEYTIKSRQSLKLPRYAADHVSRKLRDRILSSYAKVITQDIKGKTLKNIRMYDYEERS